MTNRTRYGARVPLLMLVVAVFLAAFCAGMYVQWTKAFPHALIRSAYKTLVVSMDSIGLGSVGRTDIDEDIDEDGASRHESCVPVDTDISDKLRREFKELQCPVRHITTAEAAASRIEFVASDALADPVLVKGEAGTFLDHCPAPWGCLAVEYSRSGSVSRAWPFRPDEILRANIAAESDYPYETGLGWRPSDLVSPGISLYPNGDLLVILHFHYTHPYGGGVARVAPDGRPRWYRKDYSHHRGYVVNEDLALVPGRRLNRSRLAYQLSADGKSIGWNPECDSGEIKEDTVNFVGGDGELLEQVPILDAIVESRHAHVLHTIPVECNPLHLNYVHLVGADAGGADGIAPGDLVVSLRNLNAFAILDEDDYRLKRLVRGSFLRQHGVRHLDNARFIMYDNLGTDGVHGPSRLLIVDLATGKETTVFPNDATPRHLRNWFAVKEGQFDVSPDRRRALVADVQGARAFEIRLADGEVLNIFHQVHDLSKLPGFPEALTESPWLFQFRAIYYANRWTKR